MAVNVFPVPVAKTRRTETLLSGTSWTVPAEVTFVNATLYGGGGGSGCVNGQTNWGNATGGAPGQVISTTVSTTPGASITYSIGAGGVAGQASGATVTQTPGAGGTTTFTGATSAAGGNPGNNWSGKVNGQAGTQAGIQNNGGLPGITNQGGTATAAQGAAGGSGMIVLEWWV